MRRGIAELREINDCRSATLPIPTVARLCCVSVPMGWRGATTMQNISKSALRFIIGEVAICQETKCPLGDQWLL